MYIDCYSDLLNYMLYRKDGDRLFTTLHNIKTKSTCKVKHKTVILGEVRTRLWNSSTRNCECQQFIHVTKPTEQKATQTAIYSKIMYPMEITLIDDY